MPVEARFPCNFPVFRRPISQILRLRRATLLVSFPFERGAREKDTFLRCARIRVLSQGNLNVCMDVHVAHHMLHAAIRIQDTDTTSECNCVNRMQRPQHIAETDTQRPLVSVGAVKRDMHEPCTCARCVHASVHSVHVLV